MIWNGYLDNILHEHDAKDKNPDAWKLKNCCSSAAILQRNGTVLGASSEWKNFSSADIECATGEDGMQSETVKVDELASLLAYVGGEDKPKPALAVVLNGGKKYKHMIPRVEEGDIYG